MKKTMLRRNFKILISGVLVFCCVFLSGCAQDKGRADKMLEDHIKIEKECFTFRDYTPYMTSDAALKQLKLDKEALKDTKYENEKRLVHEIKAGKPFSKVTEFLTFGYDELFIAAYNAEFDPKDEAAVRELVDRQIKDYLPESCAFDTEDINYGCTWVGKDESRASAWIWMSEAKDRGVFVFQVRIPTPEI